MATFYASKFDPENDDDRPQLETRVEYDDKVFVIKKVTYVGSELIKGILEGAPDPDKEGHDEVLFKEHTTRPGVRWKCFVNLEKKP